MSGALISTSTFGAAVSPSRTLLPAARMTLPSGAWMMPLFSMSGATRMTLPPLGVVMLPALRRLPASSPPVKFRLPLRKSSLDRFSVLATSPATSIRAPCPKSTPLGLIRNTLPLDCRLPRMSEGSTPVTRFSTALEADCWRKLVASLAPMEKLCQLMMALGVLVMVSVAPCCWKLTWPLTTVGSVGLACALKAAAMEAHRMVCRNIGRLAAFVPRCALCSVLCSCRLPAMGNLGLKTQQDSKMPADVAFFLRPAFVHHPGHIGT